MPKRPRATTIPIAPALEARPDSERSLRRWVRAHAGLHIPHKAVCRGHQAPWRFFADAFLERPPVILVLGPRGGGKSYLSALETHLVSRFDPGHGTRLLGGSLAQSQQAHQALAELARDDPALEKLTESRAVYTNGSEVRVLAASPTSVRGPHVPSLKLDEVDEIDPDCRDAALGMCMNRGDTPASVLMTSTWHRVDGPMSNLIERARGNEFPLYSFCIFEVLQRCPEERSGPNLEKCPECPIVSWCHEDRDSDPLGRPKAKRASGHYGIDALIQKARVVSRRAFEADYLCRGPKADGLWFSGFDPVANVSEAAEFDPSRPVLLAVDSGVFTGAVFFQVVGVSTPMGTVDQVHVFAEYLEEGRSAEHNARAILEVARERCLGRIDVASTDPAGNARTAVGPTVLGEYERAGLRNLKFWPGGASVTDGLALVESFLRPADGGTRLLIHPRCEHTIRAFQHYRRARRAGQWADHPEDPQHPHEDLMDALRGGLRTRFPDGRAPAPALGRVPARSVF
ncbi:hypothetical protein [Tautonia sociabilis]|uniref:Terminase large subunit gp17-like C-terminal domain-containing protein n=1 Tax=Tautonia sociabilis TaxID=2080755 RepID=A0A432MRG6_9BACT|nr:hypothetical protein [Tautonia sociabilis]RUL89607.1 hypothetical protein TsocGM_00085 [Tautonia sociabilis]